METKKSKNHKTLIGLGVRINFMNVTSGNVKLTWGEILGHLIMVNIPPRKERSDITPTHSLIV